MVQFFGGFERAIPPIGSDEQVGSQNQNRKHYVPVLVVWANNDLGVTLFLADIVIELKSFMTISGFEIDKDELVSTAPYLSLRFLLYRRFFCNIKSPGVYHS